MNKLKKIFSLSVATFMLLCCSFGLVGCGKNKGEEKIDIYQDGKEFSADMATAVVNKSLLKTINEAS